MEPVPLILEDYPLPDRDGEFRQVRLLADLDAGIYRVEWRDARDIDRDGRPVWTGVHEGEDPELALASVNQQVTAFGYEGYRDRWGDSPAAIGMQQLLDAELAAQLQREGMAPQQDEPAMGIERD